MSKPQCVPLDIAVIESLIDRYGIRKVLASIGMVCHNKAHYIRTSRSLAPELAELWDQNGYTVGEAYKNTRNPTA